MHLSKWHRFNRKGWHGQTEIAMANVLKLNDEELPVLSGYLSLTGNVDDQLNLLIEKFNLEYIVYTMGSKGSVIIAPGDYSVMEAPKVKVRDTVGAGDAFTAVLVTGLLKKWPLYQIHEKASEVAAFVCSQKGATPQIPNFFS